MRLELKDRVPGLLLCCKLVSGSCVKFGSSATHTVITEDEPIKVELF
jgi:hypothetical protein